MPLQRSSKCNLAIARETSTWYIARPERVGGFDLDGDYFNTFDDKHYLASKGW